MSIPYVIAYPSLGNLLNFDANRLIERRANVVKTLGIMAWREVGDRRSLALAARNNLRMGAP